MRPVPGNETAGHENIFLFVADEQLNSFGLVLR
jgi:hypothetical protein